MMNIYKITLLIFLGLNISSKACSPLNTPALITQTQTATNLILDWQTSSIWMQCPNIVEVEIACASAVFSGASNATYSSSIVMANAIPMTVPTMSINISNFCPGAYQFRAREASVGALAAFSQWTSVYTFTVPGVYTPPTLSITAALPNICPPQSNTLTASIGNGCGGSSNTYSWSPNINLSCPTCSVTYAAPGVTTEYTLTVTGGQIGCWTQTAAITVVIAPVAPVFGPINAFPASICAGETTTISMSYYNSGLITWQSSGGPTGPWTNIPNTNNFAYTTPSLNTGMYYRASVVGCQSLDYSNVVYINVNPNPTITAVSTTICPGEIATITGFGATSYGWSAGAYPTGINTGGAGPLTTTSYTVTGNLGGCTGTTVATVSVNPPPTILVNSSIACINDAINLTSNAGGAAYLWTGPNSFTSNLQNPVIPNAQPSMAGPYMLKMWSALGCTATAITNAVVQLAPTPSIASNNPVCLNSSLFLYGSNVNSYSWSGPNGFTSTLQNPVINNASFATGGVYTLIGTVGTCTASITRTITIIAIPNPTAQSNSPICVGDQLTLFGSGGTTYTWTGPPAFYNQGQNTGIGSVNMNNNGVFTLTARAVNGCTNMATTSVVVNPLPVIPVNNLNVCLNQSITLTSGGGATYTWSGPGGFTSYVQNPIIPVAVAANDGVYTTTVATAAGCLGVAATSVGILNLPNAGLGVSSPSLCVGQELVLSALGGITYTWTGPNGFASNQQVVAISNIDIASDGVYTLAITNGQCSGVSTRSITVFALPSPTFQTNSPVCENAIFTLAAGGPPDYKYEWLGPDSFLSAQPNFTNNSVPLTFTGIYTLNVMDQNGCRFSTTTPVTVNPIPVIDAPNVASCDGQPAYLKSNGGASYVWTGPDNFYAATANATVTNVNNVTAGTYVILVTSVKSCTNAQPVIVSLKALPVPTIVATPKACLNGTINLMGYGGDSYHWEGPFEYHSNDQNTTFTAASMSYNGSYTLAVLNSGGCTGYSTTVIEVYALPDGVLATDNAERCVPFCTSFNLQNSGTAGVIDYTWMINSRVIKQPTFEHCFVDPGSYVVKGAFIDVNGCTNVATYTVDTYPRPIADYVYKPAKPVEVIDLVEFTDMSGGENNVKWNWYFINNAGYKTTSKTASYVFENMGEYRVAMVVTNKWGCSDTTIKLIDVDPDFSIFVPDVFTPNGDDTNDKFFPKGRGVVKYDLRIYDRWGERVFQTNDFPTAWDGTFKGKDCKSDVYAWEIVASDAYGKVKDLSGHVTLYR